LVCAAYISTYLAQVLVLNIVAQKMYTVLNLLIFVTHDKFYTIIADTLKTFTIRDMRFIVYVYCF